jgi:hypothetical protein
MKFIIAQMLNSISTKSIGEELFPISNELLKEELNKIKRDILTLEK